MEELDECLKIRRKIKDIEEDITELKMRVQSPKGQVITGMPRSGNGGASQADGYLIKLEKLEAKKKRKVDELNACWNNATETLSKLQLNAETIQMLRYRFYWGYKWEKCAVLMKENFPESVWNVNKCFRKYSAVLHKIDKICL